MSKIKVLPQHEACKIAAGEVVERPVNVVKELVENSLDAGATRVDIWLEQAGKKLIRVVDDGFGMSVSDVELCFLPHATSKIKTVDDLIKINSFGFRGEALSSISAVSKVKLSTCEPNSNNGSIVQINENQIAKPTLGPSIPGTDLSVSELFYNLPARQKFLKSNDTEWRQIVQLFNAFAISHPRVHFKLWHDDKLIHNYPPTPDLIERAAQLWGAELADKLCLLTANQHDIKLQGLISNHQVYRYQRQYIYCYVNQRLIRNHGLVRALVKGYNNVLPTDRYPVAILHIELPKTQVDVNVHPRKEEVNFLHPLRVEQLITEATKQTLHKQISQHLAQPSAINNNFNQPKPSIPWIRQKSITLSPFTNFHHNDYLAALPTNAVNRPSDESQQVLTEPNYEILGQFQKTYIILSKNAHLILVDQHAAHERILYEKFRENFDEITTTKLAFPIIANLSETNCKTLQTFLPILAKHGIIAEQVGLNQIIIQSLSTHLKSIPFQEFLTQLVNWIDESHNLETEVLHQALHKHLHAQLACKAAIKAGDNLSIEQMRNLIDQLERTDNHLTCPHGRPTIWQFSQAEIEKKFKRA